MRPRIDWPMTILLPLLLAAAQTGPAPAPSESAITAAQRADLTCAAAFAIIASEQQRGVASALEFPVLVNRGRSFFVTTAEQVTDDTGLSAAAVGDVLTGIVKDLQAQAAASNDPAAVVEAVMTPCLKRLDVVVPVPPPPGMLQCAIYLQIAYQEVETREGLSPTARDLKTLASVLESRARDEMRDAGLSGNEADRKLIETREKINAEEAARDADDDASDIDFETCFELAKPAEKG